MQSSYRGRGQIEGNADLINTKAYIGRNEGALGNTLNLLATLYKGYKNIPPHIRWKLFGDQMALLEDQRSKDGGVIDSITGDYYTLPFQNEDDSVREAEDKSSEDEWVITDLRTPTDQVKKYGSLEDMSDKIRENQSSFERVFQEPSFDYKYF